MTNEMEKDKKIVPFPNLDSRLVEKGMSSLKAKKFREALNCFEQLLEIDPVHPQGHLGTVLSLVELGELTKAKVRAEKMLKQDIGDYFDVLQIYLSILIQLSEYKTVVSTIEAVLEENQLPADKAETIYQLLHFSRRVMEQENWPHAAEQPGRAEQENDLHTYQNMLESDKPSFQWLAVQQLKSFPADDTYELFIRFLSDEKKHPAVKSLILQYFKEQGISRTIPVHKNGDIIQVNVQELYQWDAHPFHLEVKKRIKSILEQENPSLMDFAEAVWRDYMLSSYPVVPDEGTEQLWANAAVGAAEILCGQKELPSEQEIQSNELDQCIHKLLEMERIFLENG
ncbi:tetratricopeptide repeat protein [Fictibacillus aquaticus]|nr:tetratricopeptide repeat protein [Fictibacillus aquaticus]